MVNFLQKFFGLEDEIDIYEKEILNYPEVHEYEKYKLKYNDRVKLMKTNDNYHIQILDGRPIISSWNNTKLPDIDYFKYKYVMYCKRKYETNNEPIEI